MVGGLRFRLCRRCIGFGLSSALLESGHERRSILVATHVHVYFILAAERCASGTAERGCGMSLVTVSCNGWKGARSGGLVVGR